jgi:hypothetical protein
MTKALPTGRPGLFIIQYGLPIAANE